MTSRTAYNNPGADGAFCLPYHYELLSDGRRMAPLRRAIELSAKGKRVLESGSGSGVLSILAARAGARVVYATEKDPAILHFLRHNLRAAGCDGVVRVIEKDTRHVTLDDLDGEQVEVVIAEHLSTWQVTEPQVAIMNHVNRHLAGESAVRIPECAFNCLELASSRYRFEDAVELRTHYFGFSRVRKPALLSAPARFRTADFRGFNDTEIEAAVSVVVTRDGVVNSLRLTSPLQLLAGISFRSSDSLMPPVVVPLAADVEVAAGDVVKVGVRYHCTEGWGQFHCEAAREGSCRELPRAREQPELPIVIEAFPSLPPGAAVVDELAKGPRA